MTLQHIWPPRLAGLAKARGVAANIRKETAADAYVDLLPEMETDRAYGDSLRSIAAKLNLAGHTTRRGRPWNPVQVARVLKQSRRGIG